ncbi:RING domain protein [Cryptosporidium ubiquitum]|uniref:RING domain protein n=1 Tax=Cryptosporidium ubiquitum TaxID=857276 RepID=A0A1J4MMV1_9CRYT|nr:RING domain protein [Cryptosporidium ubiquitum]OII74771.1 RING domain protein [Cryptosporidium ubiquitum]
MNGDILRDEKKHYSCPLCMTSTYYKNDIKMYFGDSCGHQFCSECSTKANNKKSSSSILRGSSQICPVCHSFVKYIPDFEYGETDFLKSEGQARKQVYAILNETRKDFKDTPCYDNFLEKREDLIYKLIYGNDAEKKYTQEFLNQYSKENQVAILDRKTREETLLRNDILEIVQKEGIFYEQLNQLSQNTTIDHLQIVHPLQNEYPEFFQNYNNNKNSQNTNNNQTITLGSNIPNPIDKNITSKDYLHHNSKKQSSTYSSMESRQRAGGFTENIVWSLCKNELFFGFYGFHRNSDL